MSRGHVRKRGNTWTFVLELERDPVTGKRQQKWDGGYRTKAEATRGLNEALNRVQTGTYVEPTKVTLAQFLTEQWLPARRSSVRPSTLSSYRHAIERHVGPGLGGVPIQQLTPAHLNSFYADLLAPRDTGGSGLAPKTVRNIHTILHKALGDAERWGITSRNPATVADAPKARRLSPGGQHRTWSASELRSFLDGVAADRLQAAWHLAATTGLRRGEVLGLRWADVDLAAKTVSITQSLVSVDYEVHIEAPKTARGRRLIALDDRTVTVLREHRHRQRQERIALGPAYADGELVFTKENGEPLHPDLFSQRFRLLVEQLGLPKIRLHDLRHTHATLGLQAGVHAKVVSERLGHSTVAFTMDVYSHAIPALQAEAAQMVADLIESS